MGWAVQEGYQRHHSPSRILTFPILPPSGGFDSPMATTDSIIVLDDDDEDEAGAQPGPSHPPSNPASPVPEASGPSEPLGDGGSSNSGSRKCYKLENEKLFEEVSLREGSLLVFETASHYVGLAAWNCLDEAGLELRVSAVSAS